MSRIDALLAEYGESHQNPTNKLVHWICVPIIFWSVMALIWSIPQPAFMAGIGWLNWCTGLAALVLVYYLVLSLPLALGVLVFMAVCYMAILTVAASGWTVWQVALVLFVLAWIGQLWGHKVEGRKPSFFKDVQFLLVGPAWLLGFIYRRFDLPI